MTQGLMPQSHAKGTIVELQSLRGLAALLVAVHHCCWYYTYSPDTKRLLEILLNAHAAVVLFYVLSGYVLSLALLKAPMTINSVLQFYIRRGFRIFPALWASVGLALAYTLLFAGQPFASTVSDWFPPVFRAGHVSLARIALAMVGFGHVLPLPLWSIAIELVASMLMPLFLLLSSSRLGLCLTGVALALLSFGGGMQWPMYIGGYLVDFILGIWLARHGVSCLRRWLPENALLIFMIVAVAGLIFVRQAGGWNYADYYHDPMAALLEALFATALVGAVVVWAPRMPALANPSLVYLGDISYSLYLFHLPLLALTAGVCGEWLKLPLISSPSGGEATLALLAIVLPLAVLLAALSYRWIELPGVAAGKSVAKRISSVLV